MGGEAGPPRQAAATVVPGRGPLRQQGPRHPPLVRARPAPNRPVRPPLHLGLYLFRRPPSHRRRLHPGDADGLHRGHVDLSGGFRRQLGSRCPRGARPRLGRVARGQRAPHSRQHHARATATLFAGVEPRRAGVAAPARPLHVAPSPRRLRRHRRCLLRRLERTHRQPRHPPLPRSVSLAAAGQFIGGTVSIPPARVSAP